MKADSRLVSSAGEHFVCCALAQLGWAASLTRDGLARTDILAVNTESRRMIEVQVKTIRHSSRPSWPMGAGGTRPALSDREWFVFVLLGAEPQQRPSCWIVPRDHVAAGTWIAHEAWRTDPSIPAGKRNASVKDAWIGLDLWGRYHERWELLDEPADAVEVLLPTWIRTARDRIGLPDGHSWADGMPEGWAAAAG